MIRVLAMAGFAPFVMAQIDTVTMGCPRRLNFDLSSDGTNVTLEWTAATDPTGTVYTPNYGGTCTTGANGGPFGSGTAANSPDCPTNGVPFGMNSTHQLDQTGAIYPGYAPFSPTASGIVRVTNIAYDAENGGRAVDLLVQVIPDALMVPYTSLVEMKFNSVVMPWNNDVPATQFRLTDGGLVALGYGVLPASCPSGDLVGVSLPFCTGAVGYGAEYDLKFVYGDTFSYTSWDLVDPPLDPYYVVFWDVDGDRVSNGLLNSNFTDVAGNPPAAQENGLFPSSLVSEELFEVQAVFNAQALVFSGSSLIVDSSTQAVVQGTGPPAGVNGNVQTDFSSNPYRDVNAAFSAVNEPAVAVYQVQPLTTGFRILIGAVSAVGRQYRYNGLEQPYGLIRTGNGVTSPNGPFPKRQNDRGFILSLLYPEPYCDCDDECPAECADPATADANCARNPNCVCPDACQVANPPGVCGASAQCPSVACPAECDQTNSSSILYDYYAYCRRNPNCACPAKCSGCATEAPGSATCALDCDQFAGCSTSPPSPFCVSPSPPPFPPPFPPLPCASWCNANTCGDHLCGGCSDCEAVAAGTYCASWCNVYTCEESLCSGCTACSSPSASTCSSWCSAYTCWGSCEQCAVCTQVANNAYCASWCNAYTCGGVFSGLCGGCTECAAVDSGAYCASWCNAYTCGGIFSHLCGGCSEC
mmetsp:Transcript_55940/g.98768  ORF Transcript_55940/g.98768 Transcript_55940/m.98768 type:complete len:698 (-) Transcript_55940:323-2416(-)